MTTPNDHHVNPDHAATDPAAAAKQDQIRADHAALQESARRIDASQQTTTDASAAAKQDQVRADHDALEESARRVKSSVSADVRNTPVQPSGSEDRDRR
jgi:hypothetical protein